MSWAIFLVYHVSLEVETLKIVGCVDFIIYKGCKREERKARQMKMESYVSLFSFLWSNGRCMFCVWKTVSLGIYIFIVVVYGAHGSNAVSV